MWPTGQGNGKPLQYSCLENTVNSMKRQKIMALKKLFAGQKWRHQEHIGHLQTWAVHLSVSYLFAFSYCSWGSQGKNTEVVCRSLLQWITFCQTSPPWPIRFGWSHTAWLSFIELDKVVVCVIRLASFLWLWFQCVCSWCPLATPTGFS